MAFGTYDSIDCSCFVAEPDHKHGQDSKCGIGHWGSASTTWKMLHWKSKDERMSFNSHNRYEHTVVIWISLNLPYLLLQRALSRKGPNRTERRVDEEQEPDDLTKKLIIKGDELSCLHFQFFWVNWVANPVTQWLVDESRCIVPVILGKWLGNYTSTIARLKKYVHLKKNSPVFPDFWGTILEY
jgi:hypothetical protein